MKKQKKEKHFIHKPTYEGGQKAMRAFIAKHRQYPEEAIKNKIEGTVVLRYTIDNNGKVVSVKVVKSVDPLCDEEAVRVVKLLKFKVPKNRGKRVLFHKRIQIHFRLSKDEPSSDITEISYTITSSKSKEENSESSENNNDGGYTISW